MAILRPFKAFRPTKELAPKVAALPYDVVNREEAKALVKDNPYSFLHVDRSEIDLDPSTKAYDPSVYKKAKENLSKMIENGVYFQDEAPYLYLYQLTMNGRSQIGIVGCTSIDEYENNTIKKHELTREDKEQDRIRHVDICNANTGPIFLTYRARPSIDELIENWIKDHEPMYDFIAEDGIGHRVWVLDDDKQIDRIQNEFSLVGSLYIADGHHRTASAVKVGKMRRKNIKGYTGNEEFNFFLSVLFSNEQLHIMDYNRVVADLNGLTETQFLEKVEEQFVVEAAETDKPFKPRKGKEFGMYLGSHWYKITAKEDTYLKSDPVASLDVSILQANLLNPILGIKDPRKDNRIDFVGGIRGLKELERRVYSDMKVAFALYPTSIEELMDIADADKIMPPKSTWFEPKLRSGIFIHEL